MCRFLAYSGEPVLLSDLVCAPTHSLVHQSLHADEGKTETNGDGFGIGWYGERAEPGVYRDISPAWSDENLVNLCGQVRAKTFFAHVRASTGTATARANCHPFAHGPHLFMHNGQIGGYHRIKRRLEALIPDAFYDGRRGSTDSEAIFLLALANGLADDPVGAMAQTLATVRDLMQAAGIGEPLRFTALLTDGETLTAYRWGLRRPSAEPVFSRGARWSRGRLGADRRLPRRLAGGAQGGHAPGAARRARRGEGARARPTPHCRLTVFARSAPAALRGWQPFRQRPCRMSG